MKSVLLERQLSDAYAGDSLWKYEICDRVMAPSVPPNRAIELELAGQISAGIVGQLVEDCAPHTTIVRIMKEVRGPNVMVLARTEGGDLDRTSKLARSVTVKSMQSLTNDRH